MGTSTGGIKIKIIMGSLIVFLSIMFFVYVYNVISENKTFVNSKTEVSTECLYLNFDIVTPVFEDGILSFSVKNRGTSTSDIIKANLIHGQEAISKEVLIMPSQTKQVSYSNVTDISNLKLYVNNCNEFTKSIVLD